MKDMQRNSLLHNISKSEIDIKEIVDSFKSGMSVNEIAKWNALNYQKIVKILVTEGVYTSKVYDRIKYLRECGKSEAEISDQMGLTLKAMNMYIPYKKGVYNLKSASKNAEKIRKSRAKKKD